jgi:hypothetical protein
MEKVTEEEIMRSTVQAFMVSTLCVFATQVFAQGTSPSRVAQSTTEQLRRDLDTMKEQMRQMQEKIRQQEEMLQKLGTPEAAPPTPEAAPPTPVPTPPQVQEEQLKREVKEEVLRDIQPRLTAASRTFPSLFNPAIGLVIDNVFAAYEHEGENFEFRSAEIGISASIDPFVRGYAIFNGTSDGVEVEEAALVTTALPYNFTAKGGRFFADFGRLSKFHDHDLPFVNRPFVLDSYVNGESQANGLEVSYLVPIGQYLNLTTGMYNKIGAENERVSNEVPRALSKFTYLGRAATFFSLGDAHSVDLGATVAYTPEIQIEENAARYLVGVDVTYRFVPLGQAAYRGLVLGAEFLYNNEKRPVGGFPEDPEAPLPTDFKRCRAFGMYAYAEARLSRRFYPGFLFDYAEDINCEVAATKSYSPYLTIWLSEFQRLRLQYTYFDAPDNPQNQFFVQWTAILGSHAHTFRDR